MLLAGRAVLDTNSIGNISEIAIITRFKQIGYDVFIPYGRKERYDLLIEDANEQLWRIQCKTARLQDSGTVVAFDTANHNVVLKNSRWRHYQGECDYFAAYCRELQKVYLIAVDQVGKTRVNLRLVSAKNNQAKKVRWARDYEL